MSSCLLCTPGDAQHGLEWIAAVVPDATGLEEGMVDVEAVLADVISLPGEPKRRVMR